MDMDEENRITEEYIRDDPSFMGYLFSPVTTIMLLITLSLSLAVSPMLNPLLTTNSYHSLGVYRKRTFDILWASTLHALTISSLALYIPARRG